MSTSISYSSLSPKWATYFADDPPDTIYRATPIGWSSKKWTIQPEGYICLDIKALLWIADLSKSQPLPYVRVVGDVNGVKTRTCIEQASQVTLGLYRSLGFANWQYLVCDPTEASIPISEDDRGGRMKNMALRIMLEFIRYSGIKQKNGKDIIGIENLELGDSVTLFTQRNSIIFQPKVFGSIDIAISNAIRRIFKEEQRDVQDQQSREVILEPYLSVPGLVKFAVSFTLQFPSLRSMEILEPDPYP